MGERIKNYRKRIDDTLATDHLSRDEWEALLMEHLQQIAFFQHERLVHLIVTMTVALLAVMALGFTVLTDSLAFMLAALLLIILFFPYILHYMLLENEVQKMYSQYDQILIRIRNSV